MIKLIFPALVLLAVVSIQSCKYDKADVLYPNQTCDTAKVSYSAFIAPLMQNKCVACHPGASSISLQSHSDVKAVANDGRFLNALKYLNSSSKNMPPEGKLDDCTIAKVEAWIKNGAPNN